MYTIITKWTPNSNIARYLSFIEIENALAKDNSEAGIPIISPEKYNTEIYNAWATSLQQYRNYFLENPAGIDYQFFKNDQGNVITVQTFDAESTHTAVSNQSFFNDFVTARQNFAGLIDVSFEIKKTSEVISLIDSYELAEAVFLAL
jgi:hypothetical protein